MFRLNAPLAEMGCVKTNSVKNEQINAPKIPSAKKVAQTLGGIGHHLFKA